MRYRYGLIKPFFYFYQSVSYQTAVGSIKDTYEYYSHLGKILPAMGYGNEQIRELEETINATDCEVVIAGTPIDLGRIVNVNKPIIRVKYRLAEKDTTKLEELLARF